MNMSTKHEVLQAHLKKWLACDGDRKKRGEMIKKLSSTLSINKKSVGRSMRRIQMRSDLAPPKKRGRKVYYTKDVDSALHQIWEGMEYPCAENMHSAISEYVQAFEELRRWSYGDETLGKVRAMSIATLKRRINSWRKKKGIHKGKSSTTPSLLKGMIPIRKSHTWQDLGVGHLQIDSVVHCGDRLTGDVIYSVGGVDYATYWNFYATQWNKGQTETLKSLKKIEQALPFPLEEIHPDTGNEFINYHVYKWAVDEGIDMTRSEPYKKNDNMCIEERNGSIARKHLGYVRLDDQSLVELSSEIMKVACLLHNHFIPVRRMISKKRVGARWKRTFEKVAKTPYARVLERDDVSKEIKEKLKKEHESLNPLLLKDELDKLKKELERKLKNKKIKVQN